MIVVDVVVVIGGGNGVGVGLGGVKGRREEAAVGGDRAGEGMGGGGPWVRG